MFSTLPLRSAGCLGWSSSAAGARRALAKEVRGCHAAAGDAAACMEHDVEQLVRSIHASPYKAAVYVTGGAAQVWVLLNPGAPTQHRAVNASPKQPASSNVSMPAAVG